MSHQIHAYTELQQQINYDLQIQHPEWVKSDGERPSCDSYESRLAELLGSFDADGIRQVCRRYTSRARTGVIGR